VQLPGFARVRPPTPTHRHPTQTKPTKKQQTKNKNVKNISQKIQKKSKKTKKRDSLLDALIPEQFEFLQSEQ
jgi:hypothetical protein